MKRKVIAALGAAIIALTSVPTVEAQVCPAKPVMANNGTSGNARAPSTRYRFARSVYLITQAEMLAAGFLNGASPTSLGWNYSTAPGVSGAAPLTIYMENTSDTTNTKSTTWATAIASMQVVHTGSTTLPSAAGPFDITLSGGTPFVYSGGGVYVAFDWDNYTGTLSTAAVVACEATLVGGLLGAQSNTAAPTAVAASAFRPQTRLDGANLLNDASVVGIQSFGLLPPCRVPVQLIRAVVSNNGADTLSNVPVTLTITGVDSFSDTQTITSLAACGTTAVVTFLAYTPTALGNNTVTVTIPSDTINTNNSLVRSSNNTTNDYSHKIPGSTASGGVGLNGITGAFVAKFPFTAADTITQVTLEFPGTTPPATTYRVAIYGDNAGLPSTTALYVDAADRTVAANGPVTLTLDAPVAVAAGNVYVGIHQTNTTNAGLGFDTESPIRPGMFFFSAALPVTAWTDFAPNNSFKLNVGVVLQTGCVAAPTGACCVAPGNCQPGLTAAQCAVLNPNPSAWNQGFNCSVCPTAPPCPGNTNGDTEVNVTDLLAVIGAWGACVDPNNCPADVAPAGGDDVVNVTDLLAVIGAWGPCP